MSAVKSSPKKEKVFSEEEREAMKARAEEQKAGEANGESAVLAKIAEMAEADRAMAERVHAIVRTSAPELTPRLWYGMPAYAKDDKVICFFQPALRFKSRYSTLGFSDKARLDEGAMWATSYALLELSPEVEERITALVKQAGR